MNVLELDFIRNALVAGVVVGAAAPAIGTFVVQRRLSLIGDGIGHVAFAGVAVGLWLDVSPLAAALVLAVLGALGIDRLRRRGPEEADMALALFFYGSIAAAVVVASLSGDYDATLLGFLFGQLVSITPGELSTIVALGIAEVAVIVLLYRGLLAAAIDEEAASVTGVPVGFLNVVLMVATATMIGLGMQVVGVLLVASLMVLPVGAARNLVRSFHATIAAAAAVGALAAAAGVLIAYQADSAMSGTIVLVAIGVFVLSDLYRRARAAALARRGRAPS